MNGNAAKRARLLRLHESICRCPECRGATDKARLCASCRLVEAAIAETTKTTDGKDGGE
jgi:hypothetical protein